MTEHTEQDPFVWPDTTVELAARAVLALSVADQHGVSAAERVRALWDDEESREDAEMTALAVLRAAGPYPASLLAAWFAACDKVGVPHDPDSLVRHHRANAQETANAWQAAHQLAVREREDLRSSVVVLRSALGELVEEAVDIAADDTSLLDAVQHARTALAECTVPPAHPDVPEPLVPERLVPERLVPKLLVPELLVPKPLVPQPVVSHSEEDVEARVRELMDTHQPIPPDDTDLRWRCTGCSLTSSAAFSDPARRHTEHLLRLAVTGR